MEKEKTGTGFALEMIMKINDFKTWIDYYDALKNHFCERCKKICMKKNKLLCIESNLFIVELWEIEQIYHGEIKS